MKATGLLSTVVLVVVVVWLAGPADAQEQDKPSNTPIPTTDPRPTLPATWTPTPTLIPTETPRPIPTLAPSPTPTLTPSPWPTLPPPPRAARLTGMRLVYQNYNRCAAAALTMLLLYHGWTGTRDAVEQGLTPGNSDVSVRSAEMIAFVEAQNLRAVVRTGGTLDMLRQLVVGGFPVLVENVYNPGGSDWMGHNRIVMGYDDDQHSLFTFDSVLGSGSSGNGRPITYVDFDLLWRPFNRTYLVVYPPEAEARVQAILGPQWNATANAEWTLQQSTADLVADPNDPFAWFNVGTAHLTLGHAPEAVAAFERAMSIGLPWRFLWYQFGPLEAYLRVGRYQDAIALGGRILDSSRGVEEVYYYLGQAYAALGDVQRAAGNYQQALARNAHYTEAAIALSRLNVSAPGQ